MGELASDFSFRPSSGTPPLGGPSLDWWKSAHEEQLKLCAELEQIADSLPASINRQKCIYAAKTIGPLIKTTHSYEEDVLFPAVESQKATSPDVLKTLSRLRFEHFEDECFAEELTERLLLLGAGDKDVNMEATGYMLRGFFEALKRHVAFEREHLVPFMEGLLDKKAG
jgi:hypothetical protein